MIEEIRQDAEDRMKKSLAALEVAFARIRTGRAHPSFLDSVNVDYYGNTTALRQMANVNVEEGRSLVIVPWERSMIPVIEKAILKSDLGVNPSSSGESIRISMPPLTEENRRDLAKIARSEAENARISIRNIRRDANNDVKDFLKEKEISEDELHRAEDDVQKITDMIRATGVQGYVNCAKAIRDMDQRHILKDIKVPTNIIVGDKDPACPVSASETLHSGISGSQLVILKEAAHLPNIEQKDAFNRALLGFLEQVKT